MTKRLDLPLRHGLPGWVGVVTAFMVGLPVMMINDETYGLLTPDKVRAIIKELREKSEE